MLVTLTKYGDSCVSGSMCICVYVRKYIYMSGIDHCLVKQHVANTVENLLYMPDRTGGQMTIQEATVVILAHKPKQ